MRYVTSPVIALAGSLALARALSERGDRAAAIARAAAKLVQDRLLLPADTKLFVPCTN